MRIVIATGNPHKVDEVRATLAPLGFEELGFAGLAADSTGVRGIKLTHLTIIASGPTRKAAVRKTRPRARILKRPVGIPKVARMKQTKAKRRRTTTIMIVLLDG